MSLFIPAWLAACILTRRASAQFRLGNPDSRHKRIRVGLDVWLEHNKITRSCTWLGARGAHSTTPRGWKLKPRRPAPPACDRLPARCEVRQEEGTMMASTCRFEEAGGGLAGGGLGHNLQDLDCGSPGCCQVRPAQPYGELSPGVRCRAGAVWCPLQRVRQWVGRGIVARHG